MIYGFTIKERAKGTVYVRANTPDEAQKTFSEWFNRHEDDPTDSTIDDLLDNGYEGREIVRSIGMTEETLEKMDPYWKSSIMLPEEAHEPQEPTYHFYVRFADGSEPIEYPELTLGSLGVQLANLSLKYYLFPDSITSYKDFYLDQNGCIRVYAVLKDKEEHYFTFTDKEHIYDGTEKE